MTAAAAGVVVLGCRINPDGTAPTMMKHRIQEAAEVYQSLLNDDKPHPWVIFSGCQSLGDDNKTTRILLEDYGVKPENIDDNTRFLHKVYTEHSKMKTVFGTMEFGRQTDANQAIEMVKMCMNSDCCEFDTAFMYAGGKSEEVMGTIELLKDPKVVIATKANPWSEQGLKFDHVLEQMNTSLSRLQRKTVDIFYLHAPDHKTPIEETLKAVDKLHKEGKFKQFALSNYAAWEVMEIYYICKQNNYIVPSIYQGMYNACVRSVESELFPCLRRLGISFYAYNPLAGGLLTGKYQYDDKDDKQPYGRFFGTGQWADIYRDRYWKKPLFDVLDKMKVKLNEIYGEGKVSPTEASLRWMYHHSMMSEKYGDKVILGASNLDHLEKNLKASKQDALHEDIVKIFNEGWEYMKGHCPGYHR